ncbi:hypothetical protein CVT26_000348, partial [Gymnopilus dilepis]
EDSLITLNVYDRSAEDQAFLGTVQIKPVLIHDYTVDQWYKLRPLEDEVPNGPLGSDKPRIANGAANGTSATSNGTHPNGATTSTTNGATTKPQGIQIKRPKRTKDLASTPLTNSVQENFRGFTFHGGESLIHSMAEGRRGPNGNGHGRHGDDSDAVSDEETPEVTTEDEFEDVTRSAGRYARKKKGAYGDGMDGDGMDS